MKLLFDENIAPRLVSRLADVFPGSSHVSMLGLEHSSDDDVWAYARDNAMIVVTKDADFSDMSMVRGFPPKVIWLRLGNCTTTEIETALRAECDGIQQMIADPNSGIFSIY